MENKRPLSIKEKLEQYDLFDQAITRHGMLEYIRDYELIGYIVDKDFDFEVRFVFKGCIKVEYNVKVAPENYSMDDRLLDCKKQEEPNYPKGYVWGADSIVYPGWTLRQETDELLMLENNYGIKFSEVFFDTSAFDLRITFHDLEVNILSKIEKNSSD